MKWISAQEVITFHDRLLNFLSGHIHDNDNGLEELTVSAAAGAVDTAEIAAVLRRLSG